MSPSNHANMSYFQEGSYTVALKRDLKAPNIVPTRVEHEQQGDSVRIMPGVTGVTWLVFEKCTGDQNCSPWAQLKCVQSGPLDVLARFSNSLVCLR
jgi:hypothetical protein